MKLGFDNNPIKALYQTNDFLRICGLGGFGCTSNKDNKQYFYFDVQNARAFIDAKNSESNNEYTGENTENLTSVTMTGTVSFVDSAGKPISLPSDAAIRITANNDFSNSATSSINSDGSFNVTKTMGNNPFIEAGSFTILIFKNHIEPDTVSNQCGEDFYKWAGDNLSFGSWENIMVSSSDYQDNSSHTCTQ
ncbi:MAG: hypothetical protein QM479_17340 [Pseudomonadota bacterium]